MSLRSPSSLDLARDLLGRTSSPSEAPFSAPGSLARLDAVLARLAGTLGSRTLIARAFALAKSEASWLSDIQVPLEGSLEEIDEQLTAAMVTERREGVVVLVAHVLGLLQTLIGEQLTYQFINEAWPEPGSETEDVRKDPAP